MKTIRNLVVASLVACGATVRAEHVNLWPFYYADSGDVSIAWPLMSFTHDNDNRIFPVFWGDDYFSVFPLVSHVGHTWIVPPLIVPDSLTGCAVFPIAFFEWTGSRRFNCIFPAYYNDSRRDGEDRTFWVGAGIAGYAREGGVLTSSWILPFYWIRPKDRFFATPPWVRQLEVGDRVQYRGSPLLLSVTGFDPSDSNRFGRVALGLAGWNRNGGAADSDWLFPFYYRSKRTFASLPFCCDYDEKGKMTGWLSPLLLSWCHGDNIHITPFAGSDGDSSWVVPLYYRNRPEGTFVTALGGWTKRSSWVLPLYYRDEDTFATLPYVRSGDDHKVALGFCGWNGREGKNWALPLWYRDRSDFLSIPYGRVSHGSQTNRWWGLPVVRTFSGSKTGFSVVPVMWYERDKTLDVLEKAIDSDRLEDVSKCRYGNEEVEWLFGLAGSEHGIDAWNISRGDENGVADKTNESQEASDACVDLTERRTFGNRLLYKSKSTRRVSFSKRTRAKIKDEKKYESSLFWRMYHHEESKGNSTTDVFPWFSKERKADGTVRTSFLWRFYRRECDPKTGIKLDLLFIPVWR
jgi:hypothetical protein